MKKTLLLLIMILFTAVFPTHAETWGDFEYEVREKGCVILSYSGNDKEIFIPYGFDYYNVVEIADHAFENNQNIVSVSMPGTIEVIGERAFADCTNLESLVLPVGLKVIKDEAFLNCGKIMNISLSQSVESIGRRAFGGCENLTYINDMTGANLKFVGRGAFDDTLWFKNQTENEVLLGQGYILLKYKSNVSEPVLPWYIISIAEDAFAGNDKITKLELPNYVSFLQEGSISKMDSLVSVSGGIAITSVAKAAFRDLPELSSVSINYPDLNSSNFENCPLSPYGNETEGAYDPSLPDEADSKFISEYDDELNGVVILHCLDGYELPDGELIFPDYIRNSPVVAIGTGACQNRDDIRRVILPKNLVGIKSWAFAYDTSLTEVVFPDSLEWIEADAFNNCGISSYIPDLPNVNVDPRAFYQSSK